MLPERLMIQAHEGIQSIGKTSWQALVAHESPFLDFNFLSLLEQAGCVGERAGWHPIFLTASAADDPNTLLGALPLYIKTNSAGEFVFDWSWADAAHRAGIDYYPKGLVAVPFTPVTGRRILLNPTLDARDQAALAKLMLNASLELAYEQLGLSSMHYNFILEQERSLFEQGPWMARAGIQYHWYNRTSSAPDAPACASFDDFLARFRSKRRANIRRERRVLADAGVYTRVLRADELDEQHMRLMFRFYRSTVQKFYWGQQYLNQDFFLALPEAIPDFLHVVFAYDAQDQPFAGAFNLVKDKRLYGRYWGCSQEVEFAHFEVCMYTPIQWCIEHQIEVFEPGAGGEHKYERGFEPTMTYSAHAIQDPRLAGAVSRFLAQEREHTAHQLDALQHESCLKG